MNHQQKPVNGFTSRANGLSSVLKNEISVSEAFDPHITTPHPLKKPYIGIWDTGATSTVIDRDVITGLNLKPSGRIQCQAVGQGGVVNQYEADTYRVNLFLPNNVIIIDAVVSEGGIAGGNMLLGMDIIASGDFVVTNFNGTTCWSFRFPSSGVIDFVEEIKAMNRKAFKVGRNNPCPCGSGKKYKNCHALVGS